MYNRKSHKRKPAQFRSTSLVHAAISFPLVVEIDKKEMKTATKKCLTAQPNKGRL